MPDLSRHLADPELAAKALVYFERLTQSRLRWLIRLRWALLLATVAVVVTVPHAAFPGVHWRLLYGVLAATALYNIWFWAMLRFAHKAPARPLSVSQAIADLLALSAVLWAAGGVHCPFVAYYVLHISLMAVTGTPASIIATASGTIAAILGLTWLERVPGLEGGQWNPQGGYMLGAELLAYTSTLAGVAYLVGHAVRELRAGERAVVLARERAALDDQLLSRTLRALAAGLEVVDPRGIVYWRNPLAERLAPRFHERNVLLEAPDADPETGEAHTPRARFAAVLDSKHRVFEVTRLPLDASSEDRAQFMIVYLDHTDAVGAEERLMLAERLASLGRMAQGVAHEINTPLASIQTLATDLRATLEASALPSAEVDDMRESALIIQDEARRLGRITQGLLAGGDLTRRSARDEVPLHAVVERACALVFAGVADDARPQLEPTLQHHTVRADRDRVTQILVNLLQNAYDATRVRAADAQIAVFAELDGDRVALGVRDNGEGFGELDAESLFEPFRTTKPPGKGTGLGLYTSYMLAQEMGGELRLGPGATEGAEARLYLPKSGE